MSKAVWVLILGGLLTPNAFAQSTSESKNFGMSLPSATPSYGSDEVRAADGTTCRSSMSGNGPKFDMGAIGVPGHSRRDTFSAVYGRVVIPLTKQPRRIDCYSLYQLELERLKHELEMAKGTGNDAFSEEVGGDWINEGWSDEPPEEDATNSKNSTRTDPVEDAADVEEEALAPLGYVAEEPVTPVSEAIERWTLRGMMD